MPGEGLEPSWRKLHTILSRARKPIPPPRHISTLTEICLIYTLYCCTLFGLLF